MSGFGLLRSALPLHCAVRTRDPNPNRQAFDGTSSQLPLTTLSMVSSPKRRRTTDSCYTSPIASGLLLFVNVFFAALLASEVSYRLHSPCLTPNIDKRRTLRVEKSTRFGTKEGIDTKLKLTDSPRVWIVTADTHSLSRSSDWTNATWFDLMAVSVLHWARRPIVTISKHHWLLIGSERTCQYERTNAKLRRVQLCIIC